MKGVILTRCREGGRDLLGGGGVSAEQNPGGNTEKAVSGQQRRPAWLLEDPHTGGWGHRYLDIGPLALLAFVHPLTCSFKVL